LGSGTPISPDLAMYYHPNMSLPVGDKDFSAECSALAKKGATYIDSALFNGRYYRQKLDLADRSILEPFDKGRKAGVLRDSFMLWSRSMICRPAQWQPAVCWSLATGASR
jgi:hypothetical protein